MSTAPDSPVIAIDGGGTRCRIALDTGDSRAVAEAGAANVSGDFDGAVAEIRSAFALLSEASGQPLTALQALPVYAGLAGLKGPERTISLMAALQLPYLRAEDDRAAAVTGALAGRDGAVLHAGTGSFLAVQTGGALRFAGGWGPVLGDYGSAQWLGRCALGRVLEAEDGLAPVTPLVSALRDRFGGPEEAVAFAARASAADLGAIAPFVTEHATLGDETALDLLDMGARGLERDLRGLGWGGDTPLCLTGGLAPALGAHLSHQAQFRITDASGSPLDGAVTLARQFAAEIRA